MFGGVGVFIVSSLALPGLKRFRVMLFLTVFVAAFVFIQVAYRGAGAS